MFRSLASLRLAIFVLVFASAPALGRSTEGTVTDHDPCHRECHDRAKMIVRDCVLSGEDKRDCRNAGMAYLEDCQSSCDAVPRCERDCHIRSEEIFGECAESGRPEDECAGLADAALDKCLTNCEPRDCGDGCLQRATAAYNVCLEEGLAPVECAMRARGILNECLETDCVPPTCNEACHLRARTHRALCLELGGSEADCDAASSELLEECLTNCDDPPTCEEMCDMRGRRAFRECSEAGGGDDECMLIAERVRRGCLKTECDVPPTCEERCGILGRRLFEECVAGGGDEQACREQAEAAVERCLMEECGSGETCDDRCHRLARGALHACIITGRGEEECQDRAELVYAACFLSNCDPTPGDCEELCTLKANLLERICLDLGGGAEECAAKAGELLDTCLRVECRDACGGIAGIACREGEYCRFPVGTCNIADRMGMCADRPIVCTDEWDPVCGCDGVTYGNRCEAAAAGVNIDRAGACEDEPICGGNGECREDQYCQRPIGTCELDDRGGVCVDRPVVCPLVLAPVCGCDGITYGNPCEAAAAGVNIDREGPCEEFCGGLLGLACSSDRDYCAFPPGTCEIADRLGVCRELPQQCPDVWEPVCGCDGQTYSNECDAAASGMSIDHPGPCEDQLVCGGLLGIPCPEGQVCAFPVGTCNVADVSGVCITLPDGCFDIFEPVCGCDRVTYPNRCEAYRAGVQIHREGPCETDNRCGGDSGTQCDDASYCRLPFGECDLGSSAGECAPIPTEGCPENYFPVCGCDGETYGNECEAAAAGVNIRHLGECLGLCGGTIDRPCPSDGTFCKTPPGVCDVLLFPGVCFPIPDGCPDNVDPVCGCDGETYFNPCEADAAGVNIAHPGECER